MDPSGSTGRDGRKKGCAGPGVTIALGLVLAVGGFVTAIGLVVYGSAKTVTTFTDIDESVDVGTTAEVELDEGGYYLYLEGEDLFVDSFGDTSEPRSDIVEPEVTITDPSGAVVPVDPNGFEVTVSGFGGVDRLGFAQFAADTTGTYTVEVSEPGGPVDAVAVGPELDLFGTLGSLAAALVIGLGAGALGAVILLVGIVWAIVRYSRRPKAPPPGYGPPGHGPPGYGQPGYGQPGYGQPTTGWPPQNPPPPPGHQPGY